MVECINQAMPDKRKELLFLIFRYALPFILLDVLFAVLFKLEVLNFFRTVLFLYITTFILLPSGNIAVVLWKIVARKIRIYASGMPPDTGYSKGIDTREVGVKIGFSLVLLSVFVYATFIEPNNLRIEEIEILSEKVADEVKILHISDIQSISVGRYEQKVFRLIQQLNPDIILFTGDLVQIYHDHQKRERELQNLATLFRQLSPQYGIYNVIGDTDWWLQDLQKKQWFDDLSSVKTLVDDSISVHDRVGQFRILGLSLGKSRRGDKTFIENWKNRTSTEEFTIIMGHAPDYIVNITDLDIDLCLAGHTHGGQIQIPFFGAIVTLSDVPREWAMGYRTVRNIRMNVSAGIGAEHAGGLPAIRFNCPPTMTLFIVKDQRSI